MRKEEPDGIQEVNRIKEEFVQTYMMKKPWNEFVTMVGLTQRTIVEWSNRGRKGSPEEVRKELEQAGENPNEWFIHVGLKRPLPENVSLPTVFKDIKVYSEVVGELELF